MINETSNVYVHTFHPVMFTVTQCILFEANEQ